MLLKKIFILTSQSLSSIALIHFYFLNYILPTKKLIHVDSDYSDISRNVQIKIIHYNHLYLIREIKFGLLGNFDA